MFSIFYFENRECQDIIVFELSQTLDEYENDDIFKTFAFDVCTSIILIFFYKKKAS